MSKGTGGAEGGHKAGGEEAVNEETLFGGALSGTREARLTSTNQHDVAAPVSHGFVVVSSLSLAE
jgi:hypothetical protein